MVSSMSGSDACPFLLEPLTSLAGSGRWGQMILRVAFGGQVRYTNRLGDRDCPPLARCSVVVSESSARRYALDPDVRLMLEVRDGNAAAFEELVVRYEGRLLRVLRHLVGNRELAEDLAQEVFLRVYRARESYQPEAKFSTWLYTIASHVAANALRTRSRRPEVTIQSRDSGPMGVRPFDRMLLASSGQMPARQLDKAEMREIVRLALESLGERQRMAVLLSKFEGMNYADIGAVMGLTPKAIKSLLARARENLREVLQPYFDYGIRPTAAAVDAGPPVQLPVQRTIESPRSADDQQPHRP
jgi:RNA polymerase sigma-70 factor, ECF subfamily